MDSAGRPVEDGVLALGMDAVLALGLDLLAVVLMAVVLPAFAEGLGSGEDHHPDKVNTATTAAPIRSNAKTIRGRRIRVGTERPRGLGGRR